MQECERRSCAETEPESGSGGTYAVKGAGLCVSSMSAGGVWPDVHRRKDRFPLRVGDCDAFRHVRNRNAGFKGHICECPSRGQ